MLQSFCKTLDLVVYIALSITGCYFIYHGEVWQRFTLKRTNFAEYDEPVNEVPTILTYVEGSKSPDLEYGKDFNISLGYATSYGVILKIGKNLIGDGNERIEVDFEALWDGTVFKIIPFKLGKDIATQNNLYDIEYVFRNNTNASKVSLQLTTTTGGSLDRSFAYRDKDSFGLDADVFQSTLGSKTNLIILPQTYKYLKAKGCQDFDSKNEIQLQKTYEEMFLLCEQPCRPIFNFGKRLNKIFEGLATECSLTGDWCFVGAFESARKKTQNINPCQKVHYANLKTWSWELNDKNVAGYSISYAPPPRMNVKEEYLIYDNIAFISSIGGTLGLCIGFSFSKLGSLVLGWMEIIIRRITQQSKNNIIVTEVYLPKITKKATNRDISLMNGHINTSNVELVKEISHLREELSRLKSDMTARIGKLEERGFEKIIQHNN